MTDLDRVAQWFIKSSRWCCFRVARDSKKLLAVEGDQNFYGLNDIKVGQSIDSIAALAVLPSASVKPVTLPIITLPNGQFARCQIAIVEPDADWYAVILVEAGHESQRQLALQEKATRLYNLDAQKEALIIELTKAQDELRATNAEIESINRLKTDFIARLSHEFRTPITSLLGYAEVIHNRSEDRPLVSDASDTIKRAAMHLLALVDNVLDMGRIEHHKIELDPSAHELNDVLTDVKLLTAPGAKSKSIALYFDIPQSLNIRAYVDATRLRQILINLISNAIKFTDEGFVRVDAQYRDSRLIVAVSDSGGGVDPELENELFKPFARKATDASGGAGLGLSISQHLAGLMEGAISYQRIDSPAGSCFVLNVFAPTLVSDSVNLARGGVLDGASILVVDDDPDVSALTSLFLNEVGVNVKLVETVAEAIKATENFSPKAILVDYNLPDGTGADVVNAVRERGYNGRVIAVTATTKDAFEMVKVDSFLPKPFSKLGLIEAIQRGLE